MAKSPMALNAKNKKKPSSLSKESSLIKPSSTTSDLDLIITLSPKGQRDTTYNFRDWCHLRCKHEAGLAKPSRIKRMQDLYQWVNCRRKDKFSDGTILGTLRSLRTYITFCDVSGLDPFSKAGYLAFSGNDGELWRQVRLATQTKPYFFQYNDGEELGIKERSALNIKQHIDSILLVLGFDVTEYQIGIHSFSKNADIQTQPYQPQEWRMMLRRLNFYFTSLATQLIAYRDENPTEPPPKQLEVEVDKIDGEYITITCGGGSGTRAGDGPSSPFQQCMMAGYLLFAYYTAFNATSILDVRHPIRQVKADREGRTLRYVRIKAYKGRTGKEVEALFKSSLDESMHPEVNDDNKQAGFIAADISKRDTNGIQDGLTFIEVMSLFSQAYSDDKYGHLFYVFKGNKKRPLIVGDLSQLSSNLGLFSQNRSNLVGHFIAIFDGLTEKNVAPRYKAIASPYTGFRVMEKREVSIDASKVKHRIIPAAFAALTCLTDAPLNNIVMPLRYSEKDSDGNITVSFCYHKGTESHFKLASKYQSFLEKLEAYAVNYNPLPNIGAWGGRVKRPPFLLPLGSKRATYQWGGIQNIILPEILKSYGVHGGDFLLDCTASRIRLTTSHLEYTEDDKGFGARQILQHSIKTQEKTYINGHPVENTKNMSQGMQALVKIAAGKHRNDAVEEVKRELNIPILAYDKYKARNMPTNPNGVSCDGKPDFVDMKDFHYSARKFAEAEGIISEGDEITCYQYDLCVFCKSAQLVDDPYAVYKLLSFIDAIRDTIDLFPERAGFINKKVKQFEKHVDELPFETLDAAKTLLFEQGRYFMFKSIDAVVQHISLR